MTRVDILLTDDLEGGTAPFIHDDLDVRFHRLGNAIDLPLLEGAIWALVSFSGVHAEDSFAAPLEICRRLRCHPRTAQARITGVIDSADPDVRRRAIRAGVEDFMQANVTRTTLLDQVMIGLPTSDVDDVEYILHHGDLVVDMLAYQARWQGRPISLMPTELRLLRYLVEHPGRVYTRSQLIEALGKQDSPIDERTVDVWIGRLRRALRKAGVPDLLRTVRSMGYILDRLV